MASLYITGLVSTVDKKIETADQTTADALKKADKDTKKLLADAALAQEKLLEKVKDDLQAGTDAMDATFSEYQISIRIDCDMCMLHLSATHTRAYTHTHARTHTGCACRTVMIIPPSFFRKAL